MRVVSPEQSNDIDSQPAGDTFRQLPMTPYEERAAELFIPDPELVEQYRPQFWEKVNEALATAINPHDRRVVMLTAGMLDWQIFRPNEPLPEGLVMSENSGGLPQIRFDTTLGFSPGCVAAALDRLEDVGYEEVVKPLEAALSARETAIRRQWEAALQESPGVAFVRSFDIERPADPVEQLLPPPVRDAREQQIRNAVRTEYSLAPGVPVSTNREARRTLRRGLQRLEEETVIRPAAKQSEQDAFARARAYFDPLLACAFEAQYDERMTDVIAKPDGGEVAIVSPSYPEGIILGALSYFVSRDVLEQKSPGLYQSAFDLRDDFITYFLDRLYDPRTQGSYAQVVQEAIDEATETMFDITSFLRRLGFEDEGDCRPQMRQRMAGPWRAAEDLDDAETAHGSCEFYKAGCGAGFMTRDEIDAARRHKIGRLEQGLPGGTPRLLQAVPRNMDVPEYAPLDEEPEIVLCLWDEVFDHNDPFIPGYRLAGRNSYGIFSFVRETDGDPYTPVAVTLSDEQRRTLQAVYRGIGMERLADEVGAAPAMTVEQLRKILIAHSTYTVPEQPQDDLPRHVATGSWEDFERLVAGGRLRGQCDIFGALYRLSLQKVFGKGCAAPASGFLLDGGEINALRHEQTIFSYGGRVYISDATPPGGRTSAFPYGARRPLRPAAPPRVYRVRPEDIPSSVRQVEMSPADRRRHILRTARAALEAQLMVVFRVPDTEALYEKVAAFPSDDPVRRTMEALICATNKGVTQPELHKLWAYIDKITTADASLLTAMGLRAYDPRLLRGLHAAVCQVATAEGYAQPGVSVERLAAGIESVVAGLPHDELAVAGESLARALTLLQGVRADRQADGEIVAAGEILASVRSLLYAAVEEMGTYRRRITGS